MPIAIQVRCKTRTRQPGSRRVRGIVICAALFLFGCASAIDTPDRLLESADLPAGHGTVIGSILLSVPTEVSDVHEREMIDSLKAKKYEATISRFVIHDYGFTSTVEYIGDPYRVSFENDVEKRFVIRAPAGSYTFRVISQVFGAVWSTGAVCTMEGVANFDIDAGKTTYVGQLTIVPDLDPDKESKFLRGYRKAVVNQTWLPEAALDMRVSAIDRKEETLRDLGMDSSAAAKGVATQLLRTDEARDIWHCAIPPVSLPPGAPRPPGS